MLISFVIPFYGSVPLLKRCLDSIFAQTDGDFEAIVVDDRSPECARDLVAQYDARFHFALQPTNGSAFQARNRGAEEAHGDYLVPVDPDDYVLPELVAELRKEIETSRPDMIVYNVEQDEGGRITPHWCHYDPGEYDPRTALRMMVKKKLQWNVWAKVIRRDIWLSVLRACPDMRGVYMNASEDFCVAVPMVLSCRSIRVSKYVGYRYWQNPASTCHGVSLEKALRSIRETFMARRLVLKFAKGTRQSDAVLGQIRVLARMIVRWWMVECGLSMRRLIFKRRVL